MHVITEATREGARAHIEKLSSFVETLDGLSKAGRQQVCAKMLPVMQELSLLSKTRYQNDFEITERLIRLRTHAEQISGLVKSDGYDARVHLGHAKDALSALNEIMVLEPKSEAAN